jgi:hypothetical protein
MTFTLRTLFAAVLIASVGCILCVSGYWLLGIVFIAVAGALKVRGINTTTSLLVGASLAVSVSVLGYLIPRGGDDHRDPRTCMRHLREIYDALEAYRTIHGDYPPPTVKDEFGNVQHSWRALILPYLPATAKIGPQYDMATPWNSSVNQKGGERDVPFYRCLSSSAPGGSTDYMAIVMDGRIVAVVEVAGCGIRWGMPMDIELDAAMDDKEPLPVFACTHKHSYIVYLSHGRFVGSLTDGGTVGEVRRALLVTPSRPYR